MLLTVGTHEGSKETLFRALLTHAGQSSCSQNSARSPLEDRDKLVFMEQHVISHVSSGVFSENPTKRCIDIPSALLMLFLQQNRSQMETL